MTRDWQKIPAPGYYFYNEIARYLGETGYYMDLTVDHDAFDEYCIYNQEGVLQGIISAKSDSPFRDKQAVGIILHDIGYIQKTHEAFYDQRAELKNLLKGNK